MAARKSSDKARGAVARSKKSPAGKSVRKKAAGGKSGAPAAAAASSAKPTKAGSGGAWAEALSPRKPGERRYWLVKSEPSVFSFDDLLKARNQTTFWDGVRNFAARNFLRDGMKLGDQVFFYHSSSDPQAIVGICEVVREGYPDASAFDSKAHGYDEKSDPASPQWFMVDLKAVRPLRQPVTLKQIKANQRLGEMALVRIGRLSVTPVRAREWEAVLAME